MLLDTHGRVIEYLRVSITDLCNLRCTYCRPPEGVALVSHDEILRYEEILRIVRIAGKLGIRKIRVTGGEPLVRRDVVEFIARLTALEGIEDIGLTTNGTLLTKMAAELKEAGLTRINVSLDALDRETFRRITGTDGLDQVLAGIEAALNVGLHPVKINVVLLAGLNEQDVPAFARLTIDKPLDVRFIERMPFGADWVANPPDPFSARAALEMIRKEVGELRSEERNHLDGPATMFRLDGARGRVGFIDPITGHFCATCNRLRLTARGTLRPCLLSTSEIDLRTALRGGADDEELARIIRVAVNSKPAGSAPRRSASTGEGMNLIGG